MTVYSGLSGRLDRCMAETLSWPREQVKSAIKAGQILVNGQPGKPALQLNETDQISVLAEASIPVTRPRAVLEKNNLYGIALLYEDRHILVLRKPVGMVVHPGIGTDGVTLTEVLSGYTTLVGGEAGREGVVHRLDKDTAGIMVLAKSEPAYQALVAQFQNREVEKHYYAMVRGNIRFDTRSLSYPIGRSLSDPRRQAVFPDSNERGKPAESIVTVLKRFTTKTLVSIRPITGRMHQIRVHMAHIGHPVYGDPLYGPRKRSSVGQQLLAYRLVFTHPVTGVRLGFELPLSVFETMIQG